MNVKNPAVWFEIYVDNLVRAKNFYEQVFDMKLSELSIPDEVEDEMQMLTFPMDSEQDGASGALVKMKGFEAGNNSTIIYFRSDDCAIEESKIEKVGGKILKPKQSLGEYGFMILATDSEGNIFGVHSQN